MDTGNWKWNLETWNLKQEHETINFISLLSLVNCENNLYRIVSMITAWPRAKGDPSDERSDMEVDWSQRPKFAHTILTSYILILILIKLCSAQPCISLVLKDLHLNLRCANFPQRPQGRHAKIQLLESEPRISIHLFLGFCGPIILKFWPGCQLSVGFLAGLPIPRTRGPGGGASRGSTEPVVDPVEALPPGPPYKVSLLFLYNCFPNPEQVGPSTGSTYRFCSCTIAFWTQNTWRWWWPGVACQNCMIKNQESRSQFVDSECRVVLVQSSNFPFGLGLWGGDFLTYFWSPFLG